MEENINALKNEGNAPRGRFREITIPGDVLEDEKLSDGAKIMYGKIARLSLADGKCWSSNSFLDGTESGRTASRFIAELKEGGYIAVENERSKFRKIRICSVESKIHPANSGGAGRRERSSPANFGGVGAAENSYLAKFGGVENPEKGNNIAKIGGVDGIENSYLANSGGVGAAENSYTAKFGGVQAPENAYIANSGDRTSSSSSRTAATAPGQQEFDSGLLPTVEKIVADNSAASPQELKEALSAIDGRLAFDGGFYPKAAAFISEKGLGFGYLSWLREQCLLKENVRSLTAYYFSVFFLDSMAEEYKAAVLPEPEPPPPPAPPLICPACGLERPSGGGDCPSCGLPENPSPENISHCRKLLSLPESVRAEYAGKEKAVYEEHGLNFAVCKLLIENLKKEYGLGESA